MGLRDARDVGLEGVVVALETLTAAFPEPVYLIGADRRIIAANEAMCAGSGIPREALIGSSFEQWIDPVAHSRIVGEFDAALAGETRRYRVDGRSPDGEPARAEVTNVPVTLDGRVVAVAGVAIDISGVESRERAREQTDDLLRIAGELASFGAWSLDRDTRLLTMTSQTQSILGYDGRDRIPLDDAIMLFSPTNAAKIVDAVTTCFEHGMPVDFEMTIRRADGRTRFIRVLGEPFAARGPTHPITFAHGALWDITEAVESRAREALLQHRLDVTLDTLGDGLLFLDETWRIAYANSRSIEILGLPLAEMEGRSLWECFPELADTDLEVAYQRAAREKIRTTVRTFDAETGCWLDVTAYPTETGLAILLRDVTDDEATRRQIAEAHRRIEDQAALLNAARDAIVVRGLDHGIRFWNRSAADLYGWPPDEAMGRSVRELLFSDPHPFDAAHAATMRDGYWIGELPYRTRDGRALMVECRWQLLRDPSGRPDGILSVDTDVTESRHEENLRLRAQRMESLGTLAGGIAHDLNNVLTPILMSVQLLESSETEDSRRELLSTMESAVNRGADMIRQVLAFARGVEGRREPVAIETLLDEVRRFASDTLPSTISLHVAVDDDVTQTMGDVTQLIQVLSNLVANARDAMPDGGSLRITASTILLEDSSWSRSQLAVPGRYIVIDVVDTGHGMPPEVAEKVFDPFYTTKAVGKGTGLGLASSLAIVRSHGGYIRVHSEPEQGARFSVILPLAEGGPPIGRTQQPPSPRMPRGTGELVLIVDDEPTIRLITSQTLETYGYRTVTAENGRVAFELVESSVNEIDLVLTDMMMPVIDGAETSAWLEEHHPRIPVIAMSGLNSDREAVKNPGMGVAAFLPKPFTTSLLLSTIREVLDGRHGAGTDEGGMGR